jgi:dTMP kinase
MKGHLFVFEGVDGVGKTSIIELLYKELVKQKISVKIIGFPGYEKGTLGHLIYNIHDNPNNFNISSIDPSSIQLLHVAAHIDSINKEIIPALINNTIVLLDRYWWSTYIYGKISGIKVSTLNKIIEIEKDYWNTILPDKLFFIKRTTSLKQVIDVQKWYNLQNEYSILSNKEKLYYPIYEIINESTLDIAFNTILKDIFQSI